MLKMIAMVVPHGKAKLVPTPDRKELLIRVLGGLEALNKQLFE